MYIYYFDSVLALVGIVIPPLVFLFLLSPSLTLDRVYEWVFSHCHSEDIADPVKAVFIRGLHEVLSSDSAKSQGPLMQVCVHLQISSSQLVKFVGVV